MSQVAEGLTMVNSAGAQIVDICCKEVNQCRY